MSGLLDLFRSVLEQDRAPIVLCDLEHTVVYLNPAAACHYTRYGGADLCGRSILDCHPAPARDKLLAVVAWFAESREHNMVYTFRNDVEQKDVYMVALRDQEGCLIGYYEKHECRAPESAGLYDMTSSLI